MMTINKKNLGIYLHIPFCLSKCSYCDFYSITDFNDNLMEEYRNSIKKEIKYFAQKYGDSYLVDTVFLGGGTPSTLKTEYLYEILDEVYKNFHVYENSEISMELNPKTVNLQKIKDYKNMGVNRISVGIQSMDDKILKTLGRAHNKIEAVETVSRIKSAGFENYSIDLMFAVPGQDISSWKKTLQEAVDLGSPHISLYSLEIMENTPIEKLISKDILRVTEEEDDREMYYFAMEYLEQKGMKQYEISNVAKPGFQCRHNLKYWNLDDYLGLGPSSHSYMNHERFFNSQDVRAYIKKINSGGFEPIEKHKNTLEEDIKEYVFTRLRTSEGLEYNEFSKRFNLDFWEFYSNQVYDKMKIFREERLLEADEKGIRLSRRGMSLSNSIMCYFV